MPPTLTIDRHRPDPADPDRLLLIVVGAHLEAEIHERPAASALAGAFADRFAPIHGGRALRPVVVTDLWYLNDRRLRHRPVVSVGGPETNAFTAQIIERLPQAYVIDDVLAVQLDVAMGDLVAACWGVSPAATLAAVEIFAERWLAAFADAALHE